MERALCSPAGAPGASLTATAPPKDVAVALLPPPPPLGSSGPGLARRESTDDARRVGSASMKNSSPGGGLDQRGNRCSTTWRSPSPRPLPPPPPLGSSRPELADVVRLQSDRHRDAPRPGNARRSGGSPGAGDDRRQRRSTTRRSPSPPPPPPPPPAPPLLGSSRPERDAVVRRENDNDTEHGRFQAVGAETEIGWCSHVAADDTELATSHIVVADTKHGRFQAVGAETEIGWCSHVAADATELATSHIVVADTEHGRFQAVGAETERCTHIAADTSELARSYVADDNTELQRTRFVAKIIELTEDDENHDWPPKPEKTTRMHHIERHRSCVVTLSEIELNGLQPHCLQQTTKISKIPGGGSQCSLHEKTPTDTNASHRHAIADAAWEALKRSIYKSQGGGLNYAELFARDFIPSALDVLMKETARLQSGADFGETAIGRVAPADSGLWWITLLRSYTKWTGDNSLADSTNCQRAMHLILWLCLLEGCDTSPALLCADGCLMIDRRMALFFMAMRYALSLLIQESDHDFVNHITQRIQALIYHIHSFYCYKTEEYSQTALNKFDVISKPISGWIFDFISDNSLAESPNCQRVMHHIIRLCLSEGCDTSSALLYADRRMVILGCPIEFKARYFMAIADAYWEVIKRSIVYFKGHSIRTVAAVDKPQGAAFNYDNNGSSSLNTVTICLDGSNEEVLASFRNAIGRIRMYSKTKGKSVDISGIFGPNVEAFTTAEEGTIYVRLQYKNRYITLCLKARDLYFMGWRSEIGTFEIRLENEESYMVGKNITLVKLSKNYGVLSPDRKVGLTRVGPSPVREGFEVLFKCRGEISKEVRQAIGRFAVLISESVRLQSVFNTVCLSYSDPDFNECLLDNTPYGKNSFWIQRYGHYSGQLMEHIAALKAGEIPEPIENKGDDDISSRIEILREIRVLLLDACYRGEFDHKSAPKPMTEEPLKHHPKSDFESDDTFPASILNDLPEASELERRCEAGLKRIDEMKAKQAQQATSNSTQDKYGEFLDHFPAVKRRFTTLRTTSVSSTTDRVLLPKRLATSPPLQKPLAPIYASPAHIEKLQAPSVLRLQPPVQPQRIHSLQPSLARATRFMGRLVRFIH